MYNQPKEEAMEANLTFVAHKSSTFVSKHLIEY
jgi:hypothetical protein